MATDPPVPTQPVLSIVADAAAASFVGRQPIFDARQRIHGYELLSRPGAGASGSAAADTISTARVILDTFLDIGLDAVVGPHLAFINATREFLTEGLAFQLPADRVVIEVLETVSPDAEVIGVLRELRQAGYTIALDDFVYRPDLDPLVACADLVKVDIAAFTPLQLLDQVRRLSALGLRLVAERVETPRDFSRCKMLGFHLFQGYFLATPVVLRAHRRTPSNTTALRLLAMIEDPALRFEDLEAAIGTDPTLSFRLLRVINSAAFALRQPVDSLRQALVLLGLRRIHDWVTLMVLAGLSDKPPELVSTALVRAKMSELLAAATDGVHAPAAFTVGLFSTLDALLETPIEELVREVPLSPETAAALVERTGTLGRILTIVLAYERCAWEALDADGWSPLALRSAYLEALGWARRYTAHLAADAA